MRPVTRGPAPRAYARYQDAIGDLEDRLGTYCSYCERQLPASLAVEHVSPKSLDPAAERDWENFLLGCTNCNSVKGATPTAIADCFWPDRDNPVRALRYERDGSVQTRGGLPPAHVVMANKLVELVGLDRHGARPGAPKPAPRDKRWRQRERIWRKAERCKQLLAKLGPEARELVVEAAEGYGFFSVWLTVFADDLETKRALIAVMPGTATECFDSNANPVARPGGRI